MGGGIPREETWARQRAPRIRSSSSCVSIGWLQPSPKEQACFSPPSAHTPPLLQRQPLAYTQASACVHITLCLSTSAVIRTDCTEGNDFWETYDQNPALFLQRQFCSRDALQSSELSLPPKSAEVPHAAHPSFTTNSCLALRTTCFVPSTSEKTALPSLAHFNKNNSILYGKLDNLPGAVIIR